MQIHTCMHIHKNMGIFVHFFPFCLSLISLQTARLRNHYMCSTMAMARRGNIYTLVREICLFFTILRKMILTLNIYCFRRKSHHRIQKSRISNHVSEIDNLSEVMRLALLEEKVDFVDLLITWGFVMSSFLTVVELRNLYNLTVGNHMYLMRTEQGF